MSKIKSKSSTRNILFGISASWLRLVVFTLITIFQMPVLFGNLSEEELGVWFIFLTLLTFIQVTDLGLPASISRAIAYIKEDKTGTNNLSDKVKFFSQFTIKDIYISSISSFSVICFAVILLSSIVLYLFNPFSGLSDISQQEISIAFILFVAGVMFYMLSVIVVSCLNGLGDVGFDNLIRIVGQSASFAVIIILLPVYQNIIVLCSIYLVQAIFSLFASIFILYRRHNQSFKEKGKISISLLQRLYSESFPLFINQIGTWLILQSNILIATYFIGVEHIADFSILSQIIFLGSTLALAISLALTPFVATEYSLNNHQKVKDFFFINLKASIFIITLWLVVISVWAEEILTVWVGPGHFLGYSVLIPLAINCYLETHHSIFGSFVWVTGDWPFAKWAIFTGILNLFLASIGCYFWGFQGLVIGNLVSKLITINWFVVYYGLKKLQINLTFYSKFYFSKLLIFLFFTLLLSFLLKIMFGSFSGYPNFITSLNFEKLTIIVFSSFLLLGFSLLIYFKMFLSSQEKQLIFNFKSILKLRSKS